MRVQTSLFGAEENELTVSAIPPTEIGKTLLKMGAEELNSLSGMGDVISQSLIEWVEEESTGELLQKLEDTGIVCLQSAGSGMEQTFAGKTFVLTGALPTLSREQARQMIKDRGGNVGSSVSKKTDYVLAGEDPGSKLDDAKQLNVKVIDEVEFREIVL